MFESARRYAYMLLEQVCDVHIPVARCNASDQASSKCGYHMTGAGKIFGEAFDVVLFFCFRGNKNIISEQTCYFGEEFASRIPSAQACSLSLEKYCFPRFSRTQSSEVRIRNAFDSASISHSKTRSKRSWILTVYLISGQDRKRLRLCLCI